MKDKRRSYRPMNQEELEGIFSLSREQLLEVSLMGVVRRGSVAGGPLLNAGWCTSSGGKHLQMVVRLP